MKIKIKQISLIISSICILAISGWFYYVQTETTANQCQGTFNAFAYTPPDKNGDPKLVTDALPHAPWGFEAALPDIPKVPYIIFSVEASRSIDNYSEIWVRRYGEGNSYFDSESEFYQFLIYRTDTQDWRVVSAQVEGSNAYIDKIFILEDGSVWGHNIWSSSSDYLGLPILSKFNEQSREFEFVDSTKNLPVAWRDSDSRTNDIIFWSEILLDPNDFFWIIPRKDTIYTYDPLTQKTEKHADISDVYTENAALSPDGNIYLSRKIEGSLFSFPDYEFNNREILRYDPETQELKVMENPNERWPSYGNLYTDNSGRLWLGAVGWLSPEDGWHRIYPNPFWHFFRIEIGGVYGWVEPEILFESSDGRLWYRVKGRGMAWLNPSTMEGCWFTSEDTNIIEDQDGVLWMVARGNLYKYTLKP